MSKMDLRLPDLENTCYSRLRMAASFVDKRISALWLVVAILIFRIDSCSLVRKPPGENPTQAEVNQTPTNVSKAKITSTPSKSIINVAETVEILNQGERSWRNPFSRWRHPCRSLDKGS